MTSAGTSVLIVLPIYFTFSNHTCVPAHPPPYMDKNKCQPYFKAENGYCTKIIDRRLVYGTIANQKEKEKRLVDFAMAKAALRTLQKFEISKTCLKAVDVIYCNHYFPECDNTSALLLPRQVCREACEVLVQRHCRKEWPKAQELNKLLSESQFRKEMKHFDLINCTKLPNREGGKIPECFYPKELVEGIVSSSFLIILNIMYLSGFRFAVTFGDAMICTALSQLLKNILQRC